jgi:hypothetical protein
VQPTGAQAVAQAVVQQRQRQASVLRVAAVAAAAATAAAAAEGRRQQPRHFDAARRVRQRHRTQRGRLA